MRLVTLVLVGWLIAFSSAGYALDLYVAVDGNDAWTGRAPAAATVNGIIRIQHNAQRRARHHRNTEGMRATPLESSILPVQDRTP